MKKVKEIRRRSKIDKKIEEEKEKEVEGAIGEPELVWKDKQLFGCVEI